MAADQANLVPPRSAGPVEEADPLLGSKFAVPTAPPFMVPRGRLVDRLSQGVCGPVTVVTGPAGTGKTQLVASWVRARPIPDPVVWITMEKLDGRPARFWAYVVEGLRRAGVVLFGRDARPVPAGAVDGTFLRRLAADLSDQAQSVIIVLDDVSSLADAQWASDLDFVLQHCVGRLRLVLVGRWDPPLPLYRYRLAGRLTDIRGEDLAFTEQETVQLLAHHDVTLNAAALASLMEHTEGWAAGVRLFAMALQGRDDAERVLACLPGEEASIVEYFMGEVLGAQPAQVRQFLLRTSILDTITPELARLLTEHDDAGRTLTALERQNAFIEPVRGQPMAYRYHPLFAELLRAEFAYQDPEEHRWLHRRAADWFATRGRTVEAVAHAVAAGDWSAAAAAVIDNLAVGQLVLGGVGDPLGELLRDLPEGVEDAGCRLVAAALALATRDPDRSAKQLAGAEDLITGRPSQDSHALALAGAVLDTLIAHTRRDAASVLERAQLAQSHLAQAPADRRERHPELRALLLTATGTAQSWLGDLDAASLTLLEAAESATGSCPALRVESLLHLALIEACRGRLGSATRLGDLAVDLARSGALGPDHQPVNAEVTYAWVAMEHYDVEAAWRHVRAAESHRRPVDGLAAAGLAVVKSRLKRARGEIRGALQVLDEANATLGSHAAPAWLRQEITLGRARLLTASGRPDDALAILGELAGADTPEVAVVLAEARLADGDPDAARRTVEPVTSSPDAPLPASVDAWLLLATLAADAGDDQRARDNAGHALRLAEPESLQRALHEVGGPLRRILRDDPDRSARLGTLGGRTETTRPAEPAREPAEPVVGDTLSDREVEVLRHLAALWTTEEIAAAMYLSVNTVKTHIRSILRKLSASRRNEAVRRARALGII